MKTPTLMQGLLVALLLSFFGGVVHTALSLVWPAEAGLRLVIALVALAYLLYLLSSSRVRTGRLVATVLWGLVTAGLLYGAPSLLTYTLVHIGLIWLLRSLYHYRVLLPLLADLGLCALGLCTALWALSQSGSLFLALWSFFLVQALFVSLPDRWRRSLDRGADPQGGDARFQRAQNTADAALRRLSSSR
jgi:hypothetical protein